MRYLLFVKAKSFKLRTTHHTAFCKCVSVSQVHLQALTSAAQILGCDTAKRWLYSSPAAYTAQLHSSNLVPAKTFWKIMFLNTYMMKESYRISTFLSSQELYFLLMVFQGFANFFQTYHSYQFQVIDHPNELLMMIYLDSHYSHFLY